MISDRPIKIDVAEVIRRRLGKRSRYIPDFVVRGVEKLICQDELNGLLQNNFPKRGPEFCRGVLDDLDVHLQVRGDEHMPRSPRCIVVSNHPLGGLDGISMIAWLSAHYGDCPVHFVVNDLLMAVEPLKECFIPVNKHGAQSRSSGATLDAVLAGDDPVVIYPAGLVSRLHADRSISDLPWRKTVICKAIESRRDIVPVYFDGCNSRSFYELARWRKRLGLKFNYEMMLLPRELVRARSKTFTLTCGRAIPWQSLKGGAEAASEAADLRRIVYSLSDNQSQEI
ncbi:MAG: 1-acyl-sn-glycerol-3-phosphate acyltransferase [Muribaculaceae bacterium]|nr:1-acyl-sn-glycerol-3-phosphate acyltransferase [Muribaculaceae bacterium]